MRFLGGRSRSGGHGGCGCGSRSGGHGGCSRRWSSGHGCRRWRGGSRGGRNRGGCGCGCCRFGHGHAFALDFDGNRLGAAVGEVLLHPALLHSGTTQTQSPARCRFAVRIACIVHAYSSDRAMVRHSGPIQLFNLPGLPPAQRLPPEAPPRPAFQPIRLLPRQHVSHLCGPTPNPIQPM